MINLLFLLATAQASDVYEICKVQKQNWSEIDQRFETESVQTYVAYRTIQFIFHKSYFEVDREVYQIQDTFTDKSGFKCWRQHKNSFLCFNSEDNLLFWEWDKRNGDTLRDVLTVCKVNGEPAR